MSKLDLKSMCVVGAGLFISAVPLLSAHAEGRCDTPQAGPDASACAAAAQGPTELRRYVERTRGVYGLYYWDYAHPVKAVGAGPAAKPSKVAASAAKLERTPAPAR